MTALLRWALRKGLQRGVLGGETAWLVVGAAALLVRFGLKVVRKRPEVVFSEQLGVGEKLVITHLGPSGHNGRRESPSA
jgi:hypothetical protein